MNINKYALVKWIHQEIQARGTSSMFLGKGLSQDTGEYSAESIADKLISGQLKIKGLDPSKFSCDNEMTNHIPTIRCTDAERDDIEERARAARMKLGPYIRSVLFPRS